jgi:hypothetical protein
MSWENAVLIIASCLFAWALVDVFSVTVAAEDHTRR